MQVQDHVHGSSLLYKHESCVSSFDMMGDELLFSSSFAGEIAQISLLEGKSVSVLNVPHEISSLSVHNDLNALLFTGRKTVKLWDHRTSDLSTLLKTRSVASCTDNLDHFLIVGTRNGADVFDVRNPEGGSMHQIQFPNVRKAVFHPCLHRT